MHPKKKKTAGSLISLLEAHLVEWVDRANHKHLAISDNVLRLVAKEIVVALSHLPGLSEGYVCLMGGLTV